LSIQKYQNFNFYKPKNTIMKKSFYYLLSLLLISAFTAEVFSNSAANVNSTTTAPIIDGKVDAVWNNVVPVSIANIANPGPGDQTVQASWKALWDNDNLYMLFEVIDNVPMNNGAGNAVWYIHDCVEVFTDMKNLKKDAGVTNSEGEYQLRFIYGLDNELIHENPTMTTYKSVSSTTANGYVIEVKFPWAYLIANTSVVIADGLKFGADFKVTDVDVPTTNDWWPPHYELVWNNASGKKPVNFGELTLVKLADAEKPTAPTNLAATLDGIDVTLNWTASTDNVAVTGYNIKNGSQWLGTVAGNVTTAKIELDYGTTYNISVTAIDAAGNESTASNVVEVITAGLAPMPAGTPIAKASGTITLDGNASEVAWNTAAYLISRVDTWAPNIEVNGLSDFSASFKGLWDEENLYLFFDVTDDAVHEGVGNADNLWVQDCIEVIIAKNATENYKYRFIYGKDNQSIRSGTELEVPVGFSNVSTLTSTGYAIEVAIPWSTIPGISKVERTSTFNVSFSALDIDRADAAEWTHIDGILGWPYTNVSNVIALGYANDVTIESAAPAAPTGLAAVAKDHKSIDLTFTASENALLYTIVLDDKIVGSTANTNFTINGLDAATLYNVGVMASTAQKYSAISNTVEVTTKAPFVPVIRKVGIAKINVDPSIDYEVWDTIVPATVFNPDRTFDPADLSGSWKALWDDNFLYFQVKVIDDHIYNGSADGWRNDNIELHFDMNNESDGTSCETVDTNWQIDNFQYRFIAFDKVKQTGSGNAPVWTGVEVNFFDVFENSATVGYLAEIAIPWSSLTTAKSDQITFTPQLNKEFAFEIKITDKDPFVNDSGVTVYDNAEANGEMNWNLQDYSFSPNRNNSQYGKIFLSQNQVPFITSVDNALKENILSVYPNPASDILHVKLPDAGFTSISLADITGKVVLSKRVTSGIQTIDISGLNAGIYLLTANKTSEVHRFKVVVK
jgi:hypothetical protein